MKKQFKISNHNLLAMLTLMAFVALMPLSSNASAVSSDTDGEEKCEETISVGESVTFDAEELMRICPILAPNSGPCGEAPFILNTYSCATYNWQVTGGQIVVGSTTSSSIQVSANAYAGTLTVSLTATGCSGPFANINCSRSWTYNVTDCL